jgi:glycosyltransferase involved in cell wall biosynthesis
VVGTRVGGIPEVIVPEETGLLVPPKDAAALAGALERLRAEPRLAGELGRRGRELVKEKFSLEQMAQELEAVYAAVGPGAASSKQLAVSSDQLVCSSNSAASGAEDSLT